MVLSNSSKMARSQSKIVNRETFGGNKKAGLRVTSGVSNAVGKQQSNAINTNTSNNVWLMNMYMDHNKRLNTKDNHNLHLELLRPETNLILMK
jgi:hypothetical protein